MWWISLGAHGKDAWGIFRVHQFEKIEQFIVCEPDESWNVHKQMIETAEEFYKTVSVPSLIWSVDFLFLGRAGNISTSVNVAHIR